MGLERINTIRKAKGITIEELSEKSGVPISTLKKICAGITTNPNIETVKAIVKALDCKLDDLDTQKEKAPVEQGLSPEQVELLKLFDASDADGRDLLLQFARYTAKANNRAPELTDEERVRAALHRHMLLDSRKETPADREKLSI